MLTKGYQWDASLHCVRSLYLPNWQEQDCPWCKEFDLLSAIFENSGERSSWLTARSTVLKSDKDGVSDSPFLLLPNSEDRRLGDQSVVGSRGFSSMQTLFAVASAMEALRNAPIEAKRLDPRFPVSSVFQLKGFELYTEGLIRAGLMRTIKPREWGESQQKELGVLLKKECKKPDQAILLGELLLSIWRRGVFPPDDSTFRLLFGPHLTNEDLLEPFLQVLGVPAHHRQPPPKKANFPALLMRFLSVFRNRR
ncbi:MAG: hypothetical protein A3J24_11130 [Deltaproteobacteria bacterium RIFCSPLOWO2_02_FULL_53_8]|nr:MAG: hypothetical protein A3J24_11130 [Deltaproteobacteria bacterium RIFCSPLOWO2_02_FULL_53_8]